jgi:nitrogen fixation protein FixH
MSSARRHFAWPVAITLVLAVFVGWNVWLIRVATRDPSFAVEEDYYQRALRWDDELAQRRRNDALGWRLLPSLSVIAPDSGAMLVVRLDDRARPVDGARVTVRALHIARSAEPLDAVLQASGPGLYQTRLALRRPGIWELRFDVTRAGERFTAGQRLEAVLDRE